MLRKEKIELAKKLTRENKGHSVFLENDYIEGTPEEVGRGIPSVFTDEDRGQIRIWYIDKHGTARVVDELNHEWNV